MSYSTKAWIQPLLLVAALHTFAVVGQSQQGCCDQRLPAGEWQVGNLEKAVAFYHEVGLDVPPGWTGKIAAPSPANQDLCGVPGGLWRIVGLPIAGSSWGMQLVETTGVPRNPVNASRQDIGATGLILYVRNLDASLAALKKVGAEIVTAGKSPVRIGKGKSRGILARDPDGLFVEFRQMDPLPARSAPSSSNVIGAAVSISIEDTDKTARYWRDLLGFEVNSAAFSKEKSELALQGTPGAQVRKSIAKIAPDGKFDYPGADLIFEFLEFKNVARKKLSPRYQDPGSGGFVLRLKTRDSGVRGKEMADFVALMKTSSETRILTAGGNALDQQRRFAMFFRDLNGFILEATQSTPAPGTADASNGSKPLANVFGVIKGRLN
jgi:hypothetical protein